MISIVIPLYNKAPFIAETIRSVIGQRFKEFELLVVNDGSTDGSDVIVSSIVDDRLKIITIEHSGVSAARNTGIRASKYDWVAFLDADDWWDENFLAEMITCINAYPNNKLFASGRTHVFKDSVKRYSNPFIPKEGDMGPVNFFQVISRHLPLINSSNAIIRKEHFDSAGYFREKQKKHEDHDLWIRMSIDEPVVFLNKNLSFYRNTEDHSASKMYYEPGDFSIFLNTLVQTKERVSASEKKHFTRYCNRFVLLTYIKNYRHYTKTEDKAVVSLARKVVTGPYKLLLNFLNWFPYKNTYRFFKFLKLK